MQRQRGELVLIGEVVTGLDDVPVIRSDSPQARHSFTVADQVKPVGFSQRSRPRPGLHGSDDGAVLPTALQPRQPDSV